MIEKHFGLQRDREREKAITAMLHQERRREEREERVD